ncbi:hypothetical protein AAMO2058_000726200 [Amorphochlora amoebiformis]
MAALSQGPGPVPGIRAIPRRKQWLLATLVILICLLGIFEQKDPRSRKLGRKLNPALSSKRRKARKRFFTAPLNVKRRMMRAPMSKTLRVQFKKKNVLVRVGDFVKIEKGDHKGKTGRVIRIVTEKLKVAIQGITKRTAQDKTVHVLIYANKLSVLALGPRRKEFEGLYTPEDEMALKEFEATSRTIGPLPPGGRRNTMKEELIDDTGVTRTQDVNMEKAVQAGDDDFDELDTDEVDGDQQDNAEMGGS